jgi:hypothetical protein
MKSYRTDMFWPQKLPAAAALALAGSLLANFILRTLALKLSVPATNVLSPWSIVITTCVAVISATIGLIVLANGAARPYSAFRRLAVLVFLLSLAGPLAARFGLAPGAPRVTTGTLLVLVLMNAATVAIVVVCLTTIPRRR